MPGPRDVLITGIGVISPVGLGVRELLDHLRAARSGIGWWESPQFSKKFPAGIVRRRFDAEFSKLELPYLDRCSQMAILAARQALADAGAPTDFAGYAQRAGLYYGTVRGGAETEESWVRQFHVEHKEISKPYTMLASMLNAGAAHISIRHHIHGPVMTHSSACASSGAAIGEASRAIRHGDLDIALAGGAEASLIGSIFAAWDGIRALATPDPEDVGRSCRPFSKRRRGLVVGEGAVFLVLESREHAMRRRAPCYAALTGYAMAADGYHIGSPSADGQIAALRGAMADARLEPVRLGYINAHATATQGGDVVETKSLRTMLGDAADTVPVSSTKSIHGHLLGAASAMELAITSLAIAGSFLPATAHLDEAADDCRLNHVANAPVMNHAIDHALSFSAGFGGTNVALVVSKERELPTKHTAI